MEKSLDAQSWLACTKMITLLCLVVCLLAGRASGQKVNMEPEVSSYPGQTVSLSCAITNITRGRVSMVTWLYEPKDGERINIAVFHPLFSPAYPKSPMKDRISFAPDPPNLASHHIQIQNVRMSDEGKYICQYATYPIANMQGITNLVVLANPQDAASTVSVKAGNEEMVVARCESQNGRPAATISWVTTAEGNPTSVSQAGENNTVTMTCEYKLLPTPEDNGVNISCVVALPTQTKPESFNIKLDVQHAPQVYIYGYDNNWYVGRTHVVLTCDAIGNPTHTRLMWRVLSGEMPDTVELRGNELKVLRVDATVNTTFICEAENHIGVGSDQISVFVRDGPI